MTDEATPAKVRPNDQLGQLPEPRLWYDPETQACSSMAPLRPTYEPLWDEADLRAYVASAVAAERERCANQVPMNWCDPLLTGPKSVVPATVDCRVIERLLQGVKARIRGA